MMTNKVHFNAFANLYLGAYGNCI